MRVGGEKVVFCVWGEKWKNILFLGGLAERGGFVFAGLSFAYSSLIVRLTFAQRSNRKNFCLRIAGILFIVRDIFGCESWLTIFT